MSGIDQEFNALIQAEIDGGIADEDRARLREYLAGSEEAQAYYEDCMLLCNGLDNLLPPEAPRGLGAVAIARFADSGPQVTVKEAEKSTSWKTLFGIWFEFPVLRYATAFLFGAICFSILSQMGVDSRRELHIANLAGTISPYSVFESIETVSLEPVDLQGRVELLRADQLLQLRFELASDTPVDLSVSYVDQAYRLFGFTPGMGEVTALNSSAGKIELTVNGSQEFAIILNQLEAGAPALELQISRDKQAAKSLAITPSRVESY